MSFDDRDHDHEREKLGDEYDLELKKRGKERFSSYAEFEATRAPSKDANYIPSPGWLSEFKSSNAISEAESLLKRKGQVRTLDLPKLEPSMDIVPGELESRIKQLERSLEERIRERDALQARVQSLEFENAALLEEVQPQRDAKAKEQAELEAERSAREAEARERQQARDDHNEERRLEREKKELARAERQLAFIKLSSFEKLIALQSDDFQQLGKDDIASKTQRREYAIEVLKSLPEASRADVLTELASTHADEANWLVQKCDVRDWQLTTKVFKAVSGGSSPAPKAPEPSKINENQAQILGYQVLNDFESGGSLNYVTERLKLFTPDEREAALLFIHHHAPKQAAQIKERWGFAPITLGQPVKEDVLEKPANLEIEQPEADKSGEQLEVFSNRNADTANLEVQTKRTPAQHVEAFKKALKLEVLKRLDRNSKRLNNELESYSNTDTKNPEWQRLHQLADKDAELLEFRIKFASQLPKLLVQQGFSTRAVMPQFTHPDGAMHPHEHGFINALYSEWSRNHPPGAGQNTPEANQERLEQFEEQVQPIRELFGNAGKVENARDFLHAQFPALAALGKGGAVRDLAKQSNSSQGNKALLETMTKRFGDVQKVIDALQGKFNDGYMPVLELDVVTSAVMKDEGVSDAKRKSGDAESKAVLDWLDGEKRNQGALSLGLFLGQVGFTAASFFFPGGILLPLAAIGTGLASAGLDVAQSWSTAELAEAGQYGEKLTSTELDQARFYQVLSAANLALSIAAPALAGIKGQSAAVRGMSEAEAMRRAQWDLELASNPRLAWQQGGIPNYVSVNQTALAHGYPKPPDGMFYVPEGRGFQLRTFPEEVKSGGQMVKNPNFVDDAPRMQTRFDEDTGAFLDLVEGNTRAVKVPLEANVTASQIFETFTNAKSKSSFKPFAQMLEREGIATDKEILKGIEELKSKFKTYDDLRHALKERFKPAIFKKMLDPKLTPEQQQQAMTRITSGLSSSDSGNIAEQWYKRAYHELGLDKNKVDQKRLEALGIKLERDRFPDVIDDDTIYEVKHIAGELDQHGLTQFDDNMKLVADEGTTVPFMDGSNVHVKKCVYVFTKAEGVKANAKWIWTQLSNDRWAGKLSFEIFTKDGKRIIVNRNNFKATLSEFLK